MSRFMSAIPNWCHEQHIASDAVAAKGLIDQLLSKLRDMRWSEKDIFGIHLAAEEAIVNAIKHGNQNDPEKNVHIRCRASPSEVRLDVTDEGNGFCVNDVPDPTDEENLELPSGRGLMLIRSFMSTVEFNEKGNRVIMEKLRSAAP